MTIYVVHTIARGKDDPTLVGLKLEKAFKDKSKAEDYAGSIAVGERVVNGVRSELRVGITAMEVGA